MKRSHGFTLIEVLIALLIIAIAMTAVIKTTGGDIRTTQYLNQKTRAYWAASEVYNERQSGALPYPLSGVTEMGQIKILNQPLWWSLTVKPTSNGRIKKIIVDIFSDENREKLLLEWVSYAA